MKVPIVFMRKAENDMKYAICYSSRTGNTGKLAEAIRQTLPTLDCVYCGAPHVAANSADVILRDSGQIKVPVTARWVNFADTGKQKGIPFRHRWFWRQCGVLYTDFGTGTDKCDCLL